MQKVKLKTIKNKLMSFMSLLLVMIMTLGLVQVNIFAQESRTEQPANIVALEPFSVIFDGEETLVPADGIITFDSEFGAVELDLMLEVILNFLKIIKKRHDFLKFKNVFKNDS